jgi:hypothetical protein
MKHLQGFKQYNESKLGKFVAGAAITGAALYGVNALMNPRTTTKADYEETEKAHFPEFFVTTAGFDDNINVSVNDLDGVIGSKTQRGKHSVYTVTVEEGIDKIYYKRSDFGEYIYATTDPSNLPQSELLDLSELEVIEENSEYKILRVPSFWSGFDFVLVNKGYSNPKNEFEMNGQKYTYIEKTFGFFEGSASFVIKVK